MSHHRSFWAEPVGAGLAAQARAPGAASLLADGNLIAWIDAQLAHRHIGS